MPSDPAHQVSERALRFTLLGEPHWHRADNRVQPLVATDAALVALLALDGPQSRDALAGRLWPAAGPVQAANNLRQRISRLRKDSGRQLFRTGPTLSLAEDADTDCGALQDLDAEALLAAGDLLAGRDYGDNEFLDRWVQQRRERLRGELAEALAGHAEPLQKRGELAAALRLAERIVVLLPQHEHAWRRLMRLHYLRGDRTAAVAAFERFEQLLREQTGARPGAETVQLLATIESAASAAASAHAVVPVSLVQPPVRVGREHEWLAMTRAWSAGRAFVLVGEAGMGKSRLLADLAPLRPGLRAERARPGDARTPYAVLGRLLQQVHEACVPRPDDAVRMELARIVPGLGPAPQAPAQQAQLWHAAETLLRAAVAAGLSALLVDDLHFADLATLEALRWWSASTTLGELRFGFATRPLDDSPGGRLLRDWLADSLRPERIELQALQAADMETLLATLGLPEFSRPGLAQRLHAHTGGHPLFALETLKDVWLHRGDPMGAALPSPATVQDLLDHRLRELSADALDLLQVAAIAGTDLTPERAAHLLGRPAEALRPAWAELEKANLLQGQRFAHDLVQESALRGVPEALRRELHQALAELLGADAGVPPGRVAEHWQAAGQWAQAGAGWHQAGLAARRAGRLVEQQELLERAADCHARASHLGGQFEALHASFDGLMLRHGSSAVLDALPRLQDLARSERQRLQCQLLRAEALVDLERTDEAIASAGAAVTAAAKHPELRADALSLHAMALMQGQQTEPALAAVRDAGRAAGAAADLAQQMRVARSSAYVLYTAGRLADAVQAQRESLRLAEILGDQAEAAASEGSLAATLGSLGDIPASHEHARRTARRYREMGLSDNSTLGCINLIVLGNAAAYLGQFDEALATLQTAVRMAGEQAVTAARAKARLSLASVWLLLGRADEARALACELPDNTGAGMRMHAELLLARAEQIDGRSGQAHLDRVGALMDRHPEQSLLQSAWIEWSHQGDAAQVVPALEQARAQFEAAGWPGMARALQLREVARLAEIGSAEAVATAARHARALKPRVADGLTVKIYPPEAWLILAQAFERAGEAGAAENCLAEARAWIRQRALPRVPPPCRDSFLRLNPVNQRLLCAA
jgi:DNA-binding SARP family transcriptional activator